MNKTDAAREKLIVALDMQPKDAVVAAAVLRDHVGLFKVGLQLFIAGGPEIVCAIADYGLVMLDLKLHDIPNTVTHAAVNAMDIHHNIRWVTVHIASGVKALGMATEALNDLMQTQQRRGGLVGITVLTSLDTFAARQVGLDAPRQHSDCDPHPITDLVLKRARLAKTLAGIVCSPHEVYAVRRVTDAKLIVPGIRPADIAKNDQKRTGTPAQAIQDGADYLVVGRAITKAPNMVVAADAIVGEIAEVLD